MTFSEVMTREMKKRGIKQAQLAKMTGMSRAYISMIANGQIIDPKLSSAVLIIHALGMDIDEFAAMMDETA